MLQGVAGQAYACLVAVLQWPRIVLAMQAKLSSLGRLLIHRLHISLSTQELLEADD